MQASIATKSDVLIFKTNYSFISLSSVDSVDNVT